MKAELLRTMSEVEELLKECGWEDRAEWFRSKRAKLQASSNDSPAFARELRDLRSILVGMGSLSDVPMYPKPESRITRAEARQKQWELVSKLDETIEKMLGKTLQRRK